MKAAITATLAAVAAANPFSVGTIHDGTAPILSSTDAEVIPDTYIIKFKDHVSDSGARDHHSWIQQMHQEDRHLDLRKRGQEPLAEESFAGLKHTYKVGDFLGYSGHFHESVIEQVRKHPDVEFIERDSIVHTMLPIETEDKCEGDMERSAPWGLARISHRDALSFGTYNKYIYAHEGGEGVDVYVIDTGINTDHVDFEGRAKWGKTIPAGDEDVDGNGHGTHCSGTVAGKKYGVAKKANVYAVKVLRSNGSGSMSDVVKGVEFAAESHLKQVEDAKNSKRKGFKGSVANLSLGGGKAQALDAVVNAAADAGLHFAVAAGNDNADACRYSPAAAAKAMTVGASALDDSRAYFSNFGTCTDLFAPGLSIQSTWIGSKYAVNTISGTSMASPHVAGLLAYYLSLQPAYDDEAFVEAITTKKLKEDVISIATKGALDDMPKGTPNVLAWNGGGCKNYTGIVEEGGYQVEKKKVLDDVVVPIGKLGEELEKEFEAAAGALAKKLDDAMGKIEGFLHEMH